MARKEKNIHYIYKTTCNITGKWYVGMHSTSNENDDYMGSGKILRYSIRKHGKDNHTKEILEYLDTREALALSEIEIITKELIGNGLCMNLKEGGTGGFSSGEHMMNYFMAGSKNLQEKLKNDSVFKADWLIKQKLGVKNSYVKGRLLNLLNYDWNGKKHTEKTKELMCEKRKGAGIGDTNSQYGSFWVTNGIENKKNKKGLEIPEGWSLGRVTKS